MRAQASGRERLLVRTLPLALVLGMLCAALGGLVAPRGQVAHADGPTITIASPASAEGPVQTGIRVVGTGWNTGNLANDQVQVFYSPPSNNLPCGDPNQSQQRAQQYQIPGFSILNIGSGTTWTIEFQWPSNTGVGQFYICAFDTTTPTQVTASTQPFTVLATTLPGITVSNNFPNVGDQITVNGTGFLPGNQPIDLYLTPQIQQTGTRLATVTAGNDGSFSQKITLPSSPSGQLNIVALSRPSVNGAITPLTAATQITVSATPSTPTPGPSPTVTPSPAATTTATAPTTTPTTTSTSKSGLLLVVLIVLLVLVILAIIGVLIWYVVGTRPPAGVAAPPAPARGYARAPTAPRRTQSGWQSASEWQGDDEWESQQGPWEEDEQGGWNDLPTEWNPDPWPQQQGGPSSWSGPTGRGNSGAQRPMPRGPNRDDRQGRGRPGPGDW